MVRLVVSLWMVLLGVAVAGAPAQESADAEVVRQRAILLSRTWQSDEAVREFEYASLLFLASGQHESAALATLMAATTAYSAGNHVRCQELAELAISRSSGVDSDIRIIAYSLMSMAAYTEGKKAEAENWSRAARSLVKSTTSDTARAYQHFSQGIYQYYFADVRASNSELQAAVQLTAASDDAFLSINSLFYAGYSRLRLGDTQAAMNHMQEALARSTQLSYTRGIALAHREIGYIHFYLGERQPALDQFRTSKELLPEQGEFLERARVLNAMGFIYRDFGDLAAAERYHQEAENTFKIAGYRLGTLTALLNRAEIYARSGETESARQSFEEALATAAELKDEFQMSLAYEGLGRVELNGQNFDKAIVFFQDALKLTERSSTESNTISELLGAAYELKGDLSAARQHYESVLSINEQMGNSLYIAKNLYDLARLDHKEGKFDAAYERVTESVRLTEELSISLDSSELKRSYLGNSHHRFELMTLLDARSTVLDPQQADIERAFVILEKSRARSVSEQLRRNGAPGLVNADASQLSVERHLLASLSTKNDLRINLRMKGGNATELKLLESEIAKITEELDALRSDLNQRSSANALFRHTPEFEIARLQNEILGEQDVLIAFFLTDSQSFAWLIDKAKIEIFPLPRRELIESLVDRLQGSLQTRSLAGTPAEKAEKIRLADAEYATAARELSNMILGPVAEKIKGKRLIVVPDGKLNYFPISALPMPGSESDDPILLTNEVIYQPSAQTYALLKKIGQERKDEQTKDLLVFSDPVFNPSDERLTGIEVAQTSDEPYRFRLVESFSSLSRLPSSKTEAEMVSNAVGSADLFLGFDATRERLLSTNLADYKVVHLATHGFLDPERPELSSLVLSRYDRSGKPIDESIRMHDIYSMKLNADLVVLSACQTGTGKEIKGEGVMGLNTAFLQAGARSVISTLWQVEDNAANELMKEFYGRMVSEGMSPSAALRAAQIKLYNDPQFRSPFFWAAFTVHGDAATSTPFKRDNSRSVIGVAAAVLLALVVLVFGRRYRTSNA